MTILSAAKLYHQLSKNAGALNPPPKMFDDISNAIIPAYCAHILFLTKNPDCKKYCNKPKNLFPKNEPISRKFESNLSGYRYFDENPNLKKQFKKFQKDNPELTVLLIPYDSDDPVGAYIHMTNTIQIRLPLDPPNITETISNIKDIIAHELIHYAQYAIKELKKISKDDIELFGLPPQKYRSEEYDFKGYPKDIDYSKTPFEDVERQEYILRDIEFHPSLHSMREKISRIFKDLSPELYQKAFSVIVGNAPKKTIREMKRYDIAPFHAMIIMRDNQPNKWNGFVKQLYKAIF